MVLLFLRHFYSKRRADSRSLQTSEKKSFNGRGSALQRLRTLS